MNKRRSGLGSGLDALLPSAASSSGARDVGIGSIQQNPRQPRTFFDNSALEELAASIREHGIIQPLIVSERGADRYELVAGERRWRAAQLAGLERVPVIVRETTQQQLLELALIENVQRADLNPIEEASGYLALMDDFNRTQDEVAQIVGKSRPHVANTIRLLKLSEPVKQLVRSGKISAGHARLLLGQPNAERIAQEIIDKGLSVRQLEADMRKEDAAEARGAVRETKGFDATKDPDTRALEKRLSDALGLEVGVDHRGEGGTLRIKYRNLEQLDAVLRKLGG